MPGRSATPIARWRDDVRTGEFVTTAAEWLLDNFHLVTAEIADIRRNLPRSYYRQLPTLASRASTRAKRGSTRWPSNWCATATAASIVTSSASS